MLKRPSFSWSDVCRIMVLDTYYLYDLVLIYSTIKFAACSSDM